MLLIPPMIIERLMRSSLVGAFVDDPVVRDRTRDPEETVHFHAYTDDRPEICYDLDCSRPRLWTA